VSAALQTEGLGRRYGRIWGLRECSIELPDSTVTALIGPNGAGKSTLLHLVIGLIKPSTGTARFMAATPATTRAGLAQIGFVAQDHPLYRRFTVADLLRMGRALNPSWDQALAVRRIRDLSIPLNRRAGALSGGQQAQVALTLALAKRPRLLVLDEPVASLDPIARQDFMTALTSAVTAEGVTVLLSSHVVAELERVCDRLVLLHDGRVRLAGSIREVLRAHRALEPDPESRVASTESPPGASARGVVVVAAAAAGCLPGYTSRPVSFEQVVLAYLARAAEPADAAGGLAS